VRSGRPKISIKADGGGVIEGVIGLVCGQRLLDTARAAAPSGNDRVAVVEPDRTSPLTTRWLLAA